MKFKKDKGTTNTEEPDQLLLPSMVRQLKENMLDGHKTTLMEELTKEDIWTVLRQTSNEKAVIFLYNTINKWLNETLTVKDIRYKDLNFEIIQKEFCCKRYG